MMRIYHVGAWGRNHGDRAIQSSQLDMLTAVAAREFGDVAHIYPIDIQAGPFTAHVDEVRDSADLLIVGGGGLLWEKPELESRSGWQWDITLDEFDSLEGVPTALYALGWTQFPYGDKTGDDGRIANHLRGLIDRGVNLTVRNVGTRDAVRKRTGLDAGLVADPALFAYGNLPVDVPGIDWTKPVIGLCWASDKPDWRWPSGEAEAEYIYSVAETLQQSGAQVLLLEHIAGMDDAIRFNLRTRIPDLFSLEESCPSLYPPTRANVRHLTALYARLSGVLSMRKHGLYLAMSQSVPAIGLGDMPEVKWICRQYGLPWFPAAGNATTATMTRAVQHMSDQREPVANAIVDERVWAEAVTRNVLATARRRVAT